MAWLLVIVLVVLGLPCERFVAAADAPEVSEGQVKAAFLINFPKYVDWPEGTFPETNSPIVIGVLGETGLDGDLQKMIKGKSVMGHPLVFKRVAAGEELAGGSHVLFIDGATVQRAPDILSKLSAEKVLTVGDSENFLDRGGVIRLAKRDRKIRLEVSLASATQAHLKISSKLLSVADVVLGRPGDEKERR